MGPELEFIAKYVPAALSVAAVILLIGYTRKYLFGGMISNEMYEKQLIREREFVTATQEATGKLGAIAHQLEILTTKITEELGANTMKLGTLEIKIEAIAANWKKSNDRIDLLEAAIFRDKRRDTDENGTKEFLKRKGGGD